MAIICTNNLLGNDATGDGTSLNPYKSINQALSVALNGDEIRVAGGKFVKIEDATITPGVRTATFTTSIDLTSQIAIGNIISIDTSSIDGWSLEKNVILVSNISSTTITSPTTQSFRNVASDVYILDNIHYSNSTTNVVLETITPYTATNLIVSGGWNDTFDIKQGYTAVRTNVSYGNGTGHFLNINTQNKPGVIFKDFILAGISFCATSTSGAIGIDNMIFLQTNATFGITSWGIHPPSSNKTTLISNNSVISTAWNGASAFSFNGLNLEQWVSTNLNDIKVSNVITVANYRTAGTGNNNATNTIIRAAAIVDELNIFINAAATSIPLIGAGNYGTSVKINDINLTAVDTNSGIRTSDGSNHPLYIARKNGTLDSLNWNFYGGNESRDEMVQLIRNTAYGKDTEGDKIITTIGNIYFADNITNPGIKTLRVKSKRGTAGVDNFNRVLGGYIRKPSTSFTLRVRIRLATGSISNPQFNLNYNGKSVSFFPGSIGATFVDKDIVVNLDNYPDWNDTTDDFMFVTFRGTADGATFFVESLTII